MTVSFDASSRYELDPSGMTASRIDEESVFYTTYVVQSGDTIENLAYRLLGDHRRFWEIADVNPQLRHHASDAGMLRLVPGTTIRIPS